MPPASSWRGRAGYMVVVHATEPASLDNVLDMADEAPFHKVAQRSASKAQHSLIWLWYLTGITRVRGAVRAALYGESKHVRVIWTPRRGCGTTSRILLIKSTNTNVVV